MEFYSLSFLACSCFLVMFRGVGCITFKSNSVSQTFRVPVRKCEVGYDMLVLPGSTWTEGCRACRCDSDAGRICVGPICPTPYHPTHDDHCIQWSADKCCCERVGCLSYGVVYNFGEIYPKTPDSCEECLCEGGPGPEKCWRRHCSLRCVDAKQIRGHCCKQCVNGDNCSIPSLKGVDVMNNVATKNPLPVNNTRLVYSDTMPGLFYLCVCVDPGAAAMCFQNMAL
ncbi:uncharacterized protein LOC121377369 [Gigantopelta aegis]|uniref:uncharacterized protein LOC121377369 n=1 Tax=Gigantopelta aegis TaxID=1735272 RepID=UPI001B8881C9|nr:uncharacterized protein LOC121377369 [Gigantopelta aegis]